MTASAPASPTRSRRPSAAEWWSRKASPYFPAVRYSPRLMAFAADQFRVARRMPIEAHKIAPASTRTRGGAGCAAGRTVRTGRSRSTRTAVVERHPERHGRTAPSAPPGARTERSGWDRLPRLKTMKPVSTGHYPRRRVQRPYSNGRRPARPARRRSHRGAGSEATRRTVPKCRFRPRRPSSEYPPVPLRSRACRPRPAPRYAHSKRTMRIWITPVIQIRHATFCGYAMLARHFHQRWCWSAPRRSGAHVGHAGRSEPAGSMVKRHPGATSTPSGPP